MATKNRPALNSTDRYTLLRNFGVSSDVPTLKKRKNWENRNAKFVNERITHFP